MEINGIKYKEKEIAQQKMSKGMSKIMMMSLMLGGAMGGNKKSNPIEGVDVVEEFKLIQQKKSNLSRSQRNMVEYEFHKHFEVVKDE